MSINIILQARMNSTRLPNKVLKTILGKPMLEHQLLRLKQLECIDSIIVATSDETSDDDIATLCEKNHVYCYRGSLNNVLERYYNAYLHYPSDHIIRVTGDCPVIDIDIMKNVINLHLTTGADYSSNCSPATFPDGLDVEIFTADALIKTSQQATKPSELEHVTSFIRSHPEFFTCQNYSHPTDYSHFRWTVDEPEDFELIKQIFEKLYPQKPFFNLQDIIDLMINEPHLPNINSSFERNEGFKKSLLIDSQNSK